MPRSSGKRVPGGLRHSNRARLGTQREAVQAARLGMVLKRSTAGQFSNFECSLGPVAHIKHKPVEGVLKT